LSISIVEVQKCISPGAPTNIFDLELLSKHECYPDFSKKRELRLKAKIKQLLKRLKW
jgi:hypothetical protein